MENGREGQTIFLSHSLLSSFHIIAIMRLRSRRQVWVISFAAINFLSYLTKAKATFEKRDTKCYIIYFNIYIYNTEYNFFYNKYIYCCFSNRCFLYAEKVDKFELLFFRQVRFDSYNSFCFFFPWFLLFPIVALKRKTQRLRFWFSCRTADPCRFYNYVKPTRPDSTLSFSSISSPALPPRPAAAAWVPDLPPPLAPRPGQLQPQTRSPHSEEDAAWPTLPDPFSCLAVPAPSATPRLTLAVGFGSVAGAVPAPLTSS
jgi:hypothetical protein